MNRIVFICTPEETFTPTRSGAVATHVYACCREATRAGVSPIVLARPSPHAAAFDDVETILFDYPVRPVGGAAELARRIERRLRHWTHVGHGAYARLVVEHVKRRQLQRCPLVVHNDPELVVALRRAFPRAVLIHWFHNQQMCKPRPRAAFGRCVSAAIAVSDYTRGWVCGWYGLEPQRVHRVYNGVDTAEFRPRDPGEAEQRERVVINFTGRTGVEKAPDLVLEAAMLLADRGGPDFEVQVIGSNHWGARTMDPYQRKLDALADRLRARGVAVTLTGHLSRRDTAERMRRAHVHVVPSRWDEPFGLTTVEGMASGLATVGSRTGGTPEIIGDHGLLFERDRADELAHHLQHLLTHPELRATYALRARQRAEQFTWARTWRGFENALAKAA